MKITGQVILSISLTGLSFLMLKSLISFFQTTYSMYYWMEVMMPSTKNVGKKGR